MTVDNGACYVYGIVAADAAVPSGLTGLDGTSVELVEHDGAAAVVSTVDVDHGLGTRAHLLVHSQVLNAFAECGPVVPTRFGSVLPSASEVVVELLEPNAEQFLALLEELAGCAQFTLRARYRERVVLTEVISEDQVIAQLREQTRNRSEDATYYVRMRLGELVARALARKREADSTVILDALAPHAVAYNVRDGDGIDHLLDVAFLVNTEQREAFEPAAENVAAALHGRARLGLVGPLAPYDFVSEE